jgi:hypothetical protein
VAGLITYQQIRSARIEAWLGERFTQMGEFYLTGAVAFDDLDYDAPYTITVEGAHLLAPDGTPVIDVEWVRLILAKPPQRGVPIQIARAHLVRPRVHLRPSDSGYIGLNPLFRSAAARETEIDEGTAPSLLLSDIFQLEWLEIEHAAVVQHDVGGAGRAVWDDITARLDVRRGEAAAASEAVRYGMTAHIEQPGLGQLEGRALVDLATAAADLERAVLALDLSQERRADLPERAQDWLARYEARGAMTIEATGAVLFNDLAASELQLAARIDEAAAMLEGVHLPVENASASMTLREGRLALDELQARALGGAMNATGSLDLAQPHLPLQLQWRLRDLDLRQTLSAKAAATNPPYEGLVSGRGQVGAALRRGLPSLTGSGTAQVREGRLLDAPALEQIVSVMAGTRAGDAPQRRDAADVDFALDGQGVRITNCSVLSRRLAARGTGRIYYDGRLDLTATAGPVEDQRGALGTTRRRLARLTEWLLTYEIGGTLRAPSVRVRPLGLGGERASSAAGGKAAAP